MTSIDIIFQSASVLLALLAISILLSINRDASHSKRVLVLLLVVVTLMNINGVMYHSRWYLIYPQFHKMLYPFALLIAPFSYIYIRSVLLQEFRFRKYDWLVLLPSVLLAINLMPYYLLPLAEKKAYLIQYYQDASVRVQSSNGVMPSYVFPFVRVGWSLLFIVFNFRLITEFTKKATPKILADNATTLRWIKTLNLMLTILLAANLLSSLLAPVLKNDFHIPDITLGTLALVICIALFARPKILYGLYMPVSSPIEEANNSINDNVINQVISENGVTDLGQVISISSSDAFNYKLLLENFFKTYEPFLKSDYSLGHLVNDLKIPRYTLSAFINREYNMGFREFLNRQRVEYMIAHLNKPEWGQFTLKAIAEECGFSSRTTFIKNFKEITGQTPSAYVKNSSKK